MRRHRRPVAEADGRPAASAYGRGQAVPVHRGRRRLLVAGPVAAVGVCAWCGWVSGYHRSTTPAEVTWVVSLAAVVAVDVWLWADSRREPAARRLPAATEPWPRPGRGGTRRALIGTSPWLALVLVALVWEILGIDTGPHVPHLTISALAQLYRPMNAALLLVWLVVGVGYGAARARAPVGGSATGGDADRPGPGPPPAGRRSGRGAGALGLVPVGLVVHLPTTAPALLLPADRAAGVAFWLAWIAAFALADLVARRTGGRLADGEELLRFISRPMWANVLLVVAWLYAGYHLFAN